MLTRIMAIIITFFQTISIQASAQAEILCVGDLMALGAQISAAKTHDEYDFKYVFEDVSTFISGADAAIGNLETQIAGSEYGYTKTGVPGTPVLNAPEEYLEALKYAGFDILVTANNHSADKGADGIKNTVAAVKEYGFATTGMSDEELLIYEVNGIMLGVLSYTDILNTGRGNSKIEALVNIYSKERMQADISKLKEQGAEFVIVYIHWGKENINIQNDKQESMAKDIAEAGADIIIGSHPHALQPIDKIVCEDGREVIVAYSLGNFVSSMPREMNKQNAMLCFTIERKPGGKVEMKNLRYLPTYTGKKFKVISTDKLSDEQKEKIDAILSKNIMLYE